MRCLMLGAALLLSLASSGTAFSDTFSLSVPSGAEVLMQDPQALIPVTVTNNGPSRDIRSITFNLETSKYVFSPSTVPPSGWCVNSFSDGSINFQLVQSGGSCTSGTTSSRIEPFESLVFNIGVIPASSASDTVDGFSAVTVSSQSGFSMSGTAPSWTRRSLEASISASPESSGTGDVITVSMLMTNRSTTTWTYLSSSPDPPLPSSPIVSALEGPWYASAILTSGLNAASSTVNASSTAGFPSTGTLKIGSEELCYSGTTETSFTGATRGCNGTTAEPHSSSQPVYGMDPFSVAPGASAAVIWTYNADSSGPVYFSGRASAPGALSPLATSNTVLIGDFTASLGLFPQSVIDGQTITVEMTAANNGGSALVNVTPSISRCPGGAAETLISGPSPAFIPSLSKGAAGVFSWTYRVTGSVGQPYCFTGTAIANGPVITNTAASNTGKLSVYSVTTAPSAVLSGAPGVTINWNVYNGGGCELRLISIGIPALWPCSSVSPPPGWQASCSPDRVDFTSLRRRDDLAPGEAATYSINFSSAETATADKTAYFPVSVTPRGCGGETVTLGSFITVASNSVVLSHAPAGPLYADASSWYEMTALLSSGGSPLAGKTVSFSTTSGSLSSTTAVTDASGQATVRLISPGSSVNTSSAVTASYLGAEGSDTVDFLGWNKPNIQYWGGLSPGSAACGSPYTFTMQLRNIASSPMSIGTSSYLAFNDSHLGGSAIFIAYLDSPVTIPAASTRMVSFGSPTGAGGGGGAVLDTAFIAGAFEPIANSSPPPESGLFLTDGGTNDQHRSITDAITAFGACGTVRVRVLDWHEMR